MRYIFMCRSLTYAQSALRVLEKNAISAAVRKMPAGLSSSGCSYGVSVAGHRAVSAAGVLRKEGLMQGKVFAQQPDGSFSEVFL